MDHFKYFYNVEVYDAQEGDWRSTGDRFRYYDTAFGVAEAYALGSMGHSGSLFQKPGRVSRILQLGKVIKEFVITRHTIEEYDGDYDSKFQQMEG